LFCYFRGIKDLAFTKRFVLSSGIGTSDPKTTEDKGKAIIIKRGHIFINLIVE
jgi:hypothetical protein